MPVLEVFGGPADGASVRVASEMPDRVFLPVYHRRAPDPSRLLSSADVMAIEVEMHEYAWSDSAMTYVWNRRMT